VLLTRKAYARYCSPLSASAPAFTLANLITLHCRHLTCPLDNTSCALCQQNSNRRCEVGNNFAPKQLEKQPLTTSCGSPINIGLKNLAPAAKDSTAEAQSSCTTSPPEPERLCLEVRQATSRQPYITVSLCLCIQL